MCWRVITKLKRKLVIYLNLLSFTFPIPHVEKYPIPMPSSTKKVNNKVNELEESDSDVIEDAAEEAN